VSDSEEQLLTRPRAVAAFVEGDRLRVRVQDGREISVPMEWLDFLAHAGAEQRQVPGAKLPS